MSLTRLQLIVITSWFVTLAAVFGTRMALGIPTTLAESVTMFLIGCLPAVVLLVVFRGAGPRNVTQMLHDIDHDGSATAPRHVRTHAANERGTSGRSQ